MSLEAVLADLACGCAIRADTTALIETSGRRLSYAQLGQCVERAAANLRIGGLQPGERVLFVVRPSIEAIVLILAVLRAGGVLVAVEPGMSESVFAARMALVKPRWCIAESMVLALAARRSLRALLARRGVVLPNLLAVGARLLVRVGPRWPGVPPAMDYARVCSDPQTIGVGAADTPSADRPAFVVFTSGTTDAPKAVVHSSASLGASVRLLSEHLRFEVGDVAYSAHLHMIVPALLAGAHVVIPRHKRFSATRFLADVEQYGVTHTFGTPSDFMNVVRCARAERRQLPAVLRLVLLGAAPVERAFLRRMREAVPPSTAVWCVYAMTEMLPVAVVRMEDKLAGPTLGDLIGRPVPGVEARIASDGELLVRGPHLFYGYYGHAQIEEHATGDLATLDDAGRIVLLGRKKDMIIRGQHNVYPGLYEPNIASIDGVRKCSLIGVYSEREADEHIVLVVEPDSGEDEAKLERRIRAAICHGPHAIDQSARPDAIVFARLPLAGRSNKVDKRALLELVRERVAC